ncbi:hypothetical protein PLESTM_000241500 [Pleodorina starrii]|nr:hypothetical protein PLESTM_000241500 [Pleodorina starrii]
MSSRQQQGRPEPSRWGGTGAEKLHHLSKRDAATKDDSSDVDGGVDGFESPQLTKARAQVARDEVLSYMHHRRYQRKDTGARPGAHTEPRDTSFDDDSDDDDDRDRLPASRAATAHTPPGISGDAAQLLHRVQQTLDRWPPGGRAQTAHRNFGDDDLRPTSADQSPTRHARSYLEESAGSLSLAMPPAVPVGGNKATAASSRCGGADSSTAVSRAGPGRRSTAGQRQSHDQLGRHSPAGKGSSTSLSEGSFDFFKREVAARVIQTHWRRWQDWKAKVRREAESRILQQLLSDDSGLSLRMLLSGGSSSGEPSGAATTSRDSAAESAARTGAMQPSTAARPASAQVPGSQPTKLQIQLGRPAQHGRPGGGGGGVPGRLGGGPAGEGRPAPMRPATAGAALGQSRGKSPARGRAAAPVGAIASPARGERFAPGKPSARGDTSADRVVGFDLDDLSEESQQAASGASNASVQPSRKHVGGHAVYTFIATPQKQQAAAAAAAPLGSELPAKDEYSERLTSLESNTIGRSSEASTACARPAAAAPSDCATASGSGGTCGSGGAASRDLRPPPVSKPCPRMPSPPQQRHASLDADTNPAMASPALSMATDGGSGDTVLGPASPVASMAGSSSNTGSQPSVAAARRLDQPQPQPRGYPLTGSRYQDAPGPTQQADTQPRPQQQPQAAITVSTTTQLGSTANTGTEQGQQRPVPASPPLSPTREAPLQPQPPQQDMSPSPQRQGRIVALQRLKMQGSLRGTSGTSRNPTGPAESVPAEPTAPAPTAAHPHPPADGASPRRHGAPAAPTPREPEPRQELGAPVRLSPTNDREPDLTPSSEPSLTPRGFRSRRQVWQEDSDAEAERDDLRQVEARHGRYQEQHGGLSNREPRQQQHPQQQQNVPRDVEGRGRVHLLDRDQQPRQQPPKEQQGPHGDLYEEASLRALHEAGGAVAPAQRRQTGPAPRPQPQQEVGALSPRGWGQQDTARRPRDDSPTRHMSHQQPRDRPDAASAQLPQARPNRVPDLLAAYPDPPSDRAAPQYAASHRPGAGASNAVPARPLTATAAEYAARHRGTAADAPQPRITLAGDEDSLALLSARNQPRERELPQRHPAQQPADAALGRHQFDAWLEAPSRAGVMESPGRTRQLQAAGASAHGAAGDAPGAGTAPYSRQQRVDPGFGSNGICSPRDGGSGTTALDRLPSPRSSRLRSVADAKRDGDGRGDAGQVAGGGGGARGGAAGADPRVTVDASVTAEKISSILKYLDEVELQAEQEATCAALAPALLATEPATAAAVAAALLPGGMGLAHAKPRGGGAGACGGVGSGGGRTQRYDTVSATSTGTHQVTNSSRPGTAHTTASQLGPQRSQAALSDAGTALRSGGGGGSSLSYPRRRFAPEPDDASEVPMDDDGEEEDGFNNDEDAVSVGVRSTATGMTNRPAFLAESVYENVRAKIRRLQDDVNQKDARINELMQEIESLQFSQRTCLLDADARLSEMLAAQRAEYEAAVSRHMAFVDRLLADKEALSGRATQLSEQLKSADERQERTIAKLKEGWATELKRQKEGWAAAEKQRREAWMQSKATEIKDVTVKGLEGEVQKLLARHRAELSAAQQAAADEARRHLDTYVAQNEAAVRQLKERMSREAEEAVEKERAAAATRLREVSERYEQQLQTQRMRLVADADLRLEQLEQARKDDKKRYEEAVAAAKEAGEARLKDAEEDWRREKDAVRKAHDKQINALREQYETGQEGWRAAMAERARKEVSERVTAIREKLLQERNEEVQAVMTRLEAEHVAAVEALKEDFRRKEEAAAARAASALKEARRAEAKMAERFRNAGVSTKAAEDRLAAAELTISDLRRELEARNTTIRFLESQVTRRTRRRVSAAKDEASARERDVRSLGAEKAAVAAEVAAAVARDKQQVEARLAQALQEGQELRARHSAEMAAVEARVRATLARKDEVIAGLREQLAAMSAELRSTQEVLRQQQEELGSELDGGGGGAAAAASGRATHGEIIGGRRGGRY